MIHRYSITFMYVLSTMHVVIGSSHSHGVQQNAVSLSSSHYKKIYLLQEGLMFCKEWKAKQMRGSSIGNYLDGKSTAHISKKELPLFYGVEPALCQGAASNPIPLAIQKIKNGNFCLFDCHTIIKPDGLEGICKPIAVISPSGWHHQLEQPGFCFFLNNEKNKIKNLFYIAHIVEHAASSRLYHVSTTSGEDDYIEEDNCVSYWAAGGISRKHSYSSVRYPTALEWSNLYTFYLYKKSEKHLISSLPATELSKEVHYYINGLDVQQSEYMWIYDSYTPSIDVCKIKTRELPFFPDAIKKKESAQAKKKITMHVIGQHITHTHNLVLFDCTDLITNINIKFCKPVALVAISDAVAARGLYAWSKDSEKYFYIQKILPPESYLYAGGYQISFQIIPSIFFGGATGRKDIDSPIWTEPNMIWLKDIMTNYKEYRKNIENYIATSGSSSLDTYLSNTFELFYNKTSGGSSISRSESAASRALSLVSSDESEVMRAQLLDISLKSLCSKDQALNSQKSTKKLTSRKNESRSWVNIMGQHKYLLWFFSNIIFSLLVYKTLDWMMPENKIETLNC